MEQKGKATILIASDNSACINFFVYLLHSEYTLLTVKSGYETINATMNGEPELILMSTKVVGMSGYETMMALQHMNDTKKIPVIIIADNVNERERALNLGAVDCISMDSDRDLIKSKINSQISKTTT